MDAFNWHQSGGVIGIKRLREARAAL